MLEVPIPVRFRDLDSLGHVNNAVFFTYCEVARNEYWRRLFGIRRLAGANFILARAELDYRAQANGDHDIVVTIRASFIGNSSFGFEYQILEERTGTLLAEGRSVQVSFDYKTNQKAPVSERVRKTIAEFEGEGKVEMRGTTFTSRGDEPS